MLFKSLQIVAVAILATLVFIDPAMAFQGTNSGVFDTAQTKAADTFENVKLVIFIVGGFGLVGLAFFAIFGKINWKWFAALACGLFILAVAGAVIDYATGAGEGGANFNDTF